MIAGCRIEGHAVVSADDRIAGPDGGTPPSLRHPEDWRRFQAALDRAAVVIVGRLGHERNPNPGRNRLVLSSSAAGVERRADGWWWNPAKASAAEALAAAAPGGGVAAVTGGRRVFDLFLGLGYDSFFLTRMPGVPVPGGMPIFSAIAEGRSAEAVLTVGGLEPVREESLDDAGTAVLTVWEKRR
jgi:hypothetical protein